MQREQAAEDAAEAVVSPQESVRTEVMDRVLVLAKRLAREGHGALFVIARPERLQGQYDVHYPQLTYEGTVLDAGMDAVLQRLATLDGAVLVSAEGRLLAYGARMRPQRTVPGFGTRHAAARGYSEQDDESTVVMASEESGWVKVFQKGRAVVEIDPAEVEPSTIHKLSRYLVSKDVAILTAAGISVATLGVGAVGLLVLGGSYVVVRTAFTTLSGMLRGRDRARDR